MDVRELERVVRKVLREELSEWLAGQGAPTAAPAACEPPERVHPFALSDRELEQAESLLPPAERPILRTRVMAFRLEQKGQHVSASKLRRRADSLERRLRQAI